MFWSAMISATLLMGPTSAASGSPPSSPSAPSPPAFYIKVEGIPRSYLLGRSLNFVDVSLQACSNLAVIVNLFELKEVSDLKTIGLLVLEQV
jgi:hypothetical protein